MDKKDHSVENLIKSEVEVPSDSYIEVDIKSEQEDQDLVEEIKDYIIKHIEEYYSNENDNLLADSNVQATEYSSESMLPSKALSVSNGLSNSDGKLFKCLDCSYATPYKSTLVTHVIKKTYWRETI